jgi:hypothetical protein
MSHDIDNEKLTAYVLGELDEAERKAVEKVLEQDEGMRQTVAELRAVAKLAAEALKTEPAHALTEGQRKMISKRAETTSGEVGRVRRVSRLRWQVAAACALVVAVAGIMALQVGLPRPAHEEAGGEKLGYGVELFGEVMDRTKSLGYIGDRKHEPRQQASLARPEGSAAAGIRPFHVEPRTAAKKSMAALDAAQPDRYLIKNANLTIETEDARKAGDMLVAAVEELGGYVSDFREAVDKLGRRSIHVQVRVPADKFQTSMARLEPLGKVLSRQITTEDVTEQFVDTDARLRNLKRTEERLLAHLDRTGELEDVVKVEHELTRVREELEVLEGRLRFLSHRVEFSTINITLQERPKAEPVVPPETYSMAKIASEAARSLVGFFQRVAGRIIWLGIWSVVWGPLLGVVLLLVRRAIRQVHKAQE